MKNKVFSKIIIAAFFIVLLSGGKAEAQYMTGGDLLASCQSKDSRRIYSCIYYVAGVVDYHIMMQSLGTAPTISFCLPADISMEVATVTVMAYLKKSPQHHDFIAAPAVTMALSSTFPCKKASSAKKKKR